jgi:predicted Zn-dependent peptidase
VVSAAGNLDHDRVVELVSAAIEPTGLLGDGTLRAAPPRVGGDPAPTTAGVRVARRQTEQANVVLGVPGVRRTDDRRFALGVLNAALGGGMSSRLFQEVREKRGLAYAVYSFSQHYADTGMFGVYAGCQPAKLDEVLRICRGELAKVAADGITEEELRRGIGQMRGGLVLGLEDTGSRMSRLGKNELVHDELLSVDDVLARIDAVDLTQVSKIAAELATADPALAVIGPYDSVDDLPGLGG